MAARRTAAFLLTTLSATALLSGGSARAQTAPTPQQDPNTAAPTAADVATPDQQPDATEVIVTGSRIARPEIAAPNPITSFSAATLEQSGQTNLTDFLAQNPALLNSSTSADQAGSTADFGGVGTNLLDLRGLGTNRTLVLVDGRRHVAGLPGTASVDINTIPSDLIDRIDIQTGGASAIYGADAVSGVVNFILKRDFEGLRARAQVGISDEGDAGSKFFSITGGKNFADGRANVALNYEFRQDERVTGFDRQRVGNSLSAFGLVRDPSDFPDDPNRPDRILLNDLRYADSSRDGAVDVDLDGLPDFTGSGGVYDRGRLLRGSGGLTQGGSSTPTAGYQGDLQPYNRVHNVNLLTSFAVSDAVRLFAQGKYTNTRSYSVAQPSFDFFTFLAPDNAYLIQRFGAAAPDGALLSRDNYDLGIRGESNKRETYRGVVGADGQLSDHARYELSYVYGRTDSTFLSTNVRLTDRYFAALDAVRDPATGQIVCRSNLTADPFVDPNNFIDPLGNPRAALTFTPGRNSGCQPLNLLGEGVASQAALNFVTANFVNNYRVQQHVVSGSISGDFGQFFELPGGPIGFAFGGEYRKEISRFVSDPFLAAGASDDQGQTLSETGSFDVKEVFAELRVPLLRNLPFAEVLEVNAAVRLGDYSTVGRTDTYNFSAIYAPVRDIRFRGSYGQAVRAPNITELFGPNNRVFSFIDDPCDPENLPEGTQYRVANCQATLLAAGLTPGQIAAFNPASDPTATVSLPGRAGGNRNLSEETARTWTAGIVIQPRFIPKLTVTADWYDIKLKNAVRTAEAQDIVDLCVDQPTLTNIYCANITRSPLTGYISNYLLNPQNVAAFRTAGLDVQANYQLPLPETVGVFNLRVVGNYLNKKTFVPTPGADVENDRLTRFNPKFSGTLDLTWTKGPLTVNYGLNYFSKTRRFTVDQITANPDLSDPKYFFYRERWSHDLQASVAVDKRFSFYGGVNNLTGKEGDVASNGYPYPFLGRFLYAGVRVSTAKLF